MAKSTSYYGGKALVLEPIVMTCPVGGCERSMAASPRRLESLRGLMTEHLRRCHYADEVPEPIRSVVFPEIQGGGDVDPT